MREALEEEPVLEADEAEGEALPEGLVGAVGVGEVGEFEVQPGGVLGVDGLEAVHEISGVVLDSGSDIRNSNTDLIRSPVQSSGFPRDISRTSLRIGEERP